MAYSRAYQTVVAGRVREDEAIGFFGNNEIAVPDRVTSFHPAGADREVPHLEVDHLRHEGVGKRGTTSDVIDGYLPNSVNVT